MKFGFLGKNCKEKIAGNWLFRFCRSSKVYIYPPILGLKIIVTKANEERGIKCLTLTSRIINAKQVKQTS